VNPAASTKILIGSSFRALSFQRESSHEVAGTLDFDTPLSIGWQLRCQKLANQIKSRVNRGAADMEVP
jgi:hypothetical protein